MNKSSFEAGNAYLNGEYGKENIPQCFVFFMKALEEGDASTRLFYNIARCYHKGIGTNLDLEKAISFYERVLELDNGDTDALWKLAEIYHNKDDSEYVFYLQRLLENGDGEAAYAIAELYAAGRYFEKDSQKEIEYLEKAIALGSPNAMYAMYKKYQYGEGVEQDSTRSLELLIKAAKLDAPSALCDLACKYRTGEDVAQNTEKAIALMKRSAELGDNRAANYMFYICRNGEAGKVDVDLAIAYAIQAARGGISESAFDCAYGIYFGKEPFQEDKKRAVELFTFAANAGSVSAMENLGICYLNGFGVDRDKETAEKWYHSAALEGSEDALKKLKEIYAENTDKYIAVLKEAGEHGNQIAYLYLYDLYSDDHFVNSDINIAKVFLDKAVDANDSTACFRAGYNYFKGENGYPKDQSKAVELWRIAADRIPGAQYNLGLLYQNGVGVEQDLSQAILWYEKAADSGNESACYDLGYILLSDKAFQNIDRAIYYLNKAGEAGEGEAYWNLGVCYYKGELVQEDKHTAVEYWTKASDLGWATATYELGLCYKNGDGVPTDYSKALMYFEKAAEQGSVRAMLEVGLAHDDEGFADLDYETAVNYYSEAYSYSSAPGARLLAAMYEHGHGVPQDYEKALRLYKFAAEKDDTYSLIRVGILYMEGLGTEKDVNKAVSCFEKAKRLGDEDADRFLSIVYSESNMLSDTGKAFSYNLKKAKAGDPEAQFRIYQAYIDGLGVDKDEQEAHVWLKKAAAQGHVISCALMGYYSYVNDCPSAAVQYFEKAVAGGNLQAMADLADIYINGADGVPQNKERAISLYRKAAESDLAQAQNSLGICYSTGNGVPQDYNEARKWFEKAIENDSEGALVNLGIGYLSDRFGAPDFPKAIAYLERAAAKGNSRAKSFLAEVYLGCDSYKNAGYKNLYKAEEYYLAVREKHDDEVLYNDAVFHLAYLYALEKEDPAKAFPFWIESANTNNATAQYNLALCYKNGWGTSKDLNQALMWMRKALENGDKDASDGIAAIQNEINYMRNTSQQYAGTRVLRKSEGCYIATAVYGSYDCPEVWTLRRYRDNYLMGKWYGRLFVKVYYATSPFLVRHFGNKRWFNSVWKEYLDKKIKMLLSKGYMNTPYRDKNKKA